MIKLNRCKRLWQHWQYPSWRVARYFPRHALRNIERAIGDSERHHGGQIRFVVEARWNSVDILHGLTTRQRALQWFGELGVWDTADNCGVLVYVSFADRKVEVIADRGIAAQVATEEWQQVCDVMRQCFQQQEFVAGLEQGLQTVDHILRTYLPRNAATPIHDDLPNDVVLR